MGVTSVPEFAPALAPMLVPLRDPGLRFDDSLKRPVNVFESSQSTNLSSFRTVFSAEVVA